MRSRQTSPNSDPLTRLKQHLVLYVTPEGFETRLAWSEVKVKDYPYSTVVNYTASPAKFVIEFKKDSGLIDFVQLFTIEVGVPPLPCHRPSDRCHSARRTGL